MAEKFEPGLLFHVFNRANNYEDLFREEKNYYYFLKLLKRHLIPISEMYAYCLMPNHFHLF